MNPVFRDRQIKPLIALIVLCVLALGARADNLAALTRLSDEGHAEASYRLGYIYQVGEGVRRDFALAEKYLSRAVALGSRDATLSLAHLYLGHDLLSYKRKGRSLLIDAFGAGIDEAGLMLADSYAKEKYIADLSEALYWYKTMAQKGYSTAAFNAGLLLLNPAAGPANVELAVDYLAQAYKLGDPEGARKIGDLVRQQRYTFGQNKKNNPAYWYNKAASEGSGAAQYNLAYAYFTGDGVEPDLPKAYHWARLASESGDEDGRHLLGILCKDSPRYCHDIGR